MQYQTGTFTAQPGTNKIYVYAAGGGGGGGGPWPTPVGAGGRGGLGIAVIPVSQPYSVPVVTGNGGSQGGGAQAGQAGQASTVDTNVVVANAGNGGSGRGLHQVIMEISQPLVLHQQFLMLDLWVMFISKFLQVVIKTVLLEEHGAPGQNSAAPGAVIIYENNLG